MSSLFLSLCGPRKEYEHKINEQLYQRRRKKRRRLFLSLSLVLCARVCLCSFKARALFWRRWNDSCLECVSFFSLLVRRRKEKENLVVSKSLLLKSTTPNDEDFLFFVKVFFWLVQKCSCEKKQTYPREKKTRKAETTHLRNIIHRRHCIHYINLFTTKRKESTDNNKNNNKNKNKNNTLNCSNATSVTFRHSVVVFFSKRVVQLQRQKREQF